MQITLYKNKPWQWKNKLTRGEKLAKNVKLRLLAIQDFVFKRKIEESFRVEDD